MSKKNKTPWGAVVANRKASKERGFTVRVVFKRRSKRAPSSAHVFLSRYDEMTDVPESRAAAKVRAETSRKVGKTSDGQDAPLTYSEAWDVARGVACKVGADTFKLPTGERVRSQTGQRVA